MDAFGELKETQRKMWRTFAPTEMITGSVAPTLVRFSGLKAGAHVLDVGCGTGVVALTAARLGAKVTGIDLTPQLLDHARVNGALMGAEVTWNEGDAEALPFADASFDCVLSQFGHIFAPRPELSTREMLRVLRPGGTIAFSTWPPELFMGRLFALAERYLPTEPLEGSSPPMQWGDPSVVRERLGDKVKDLSFARDAIHCQVLSPQHARIFLEAHIGPVTAVVKMLEAGDRSRLSRLRRELEETVSLYFEDNVLRQDFLMSRAVKV